LKQLNPLQKEESPGNKGITTTPVSTKITKNKNK
jgi:hypothetical protein